MFQQPSQGDQIKVAEHLGSLALIYVHEFREDFPTVHGPSDAVVADVHILDGATAGKSFGNTMLFNKALVGSLRSAAGGDPVLGRIAQGVAKPGQTAPYILQPFTDADAKVGMAWVEAHKPGFQQASNGNGTAAPKAGNGAASPAAATPSPAAASPATGNSAITPEAFAALPPEVQELLKQSGAVPA